MNYFEKKKLQSIKKDKEERKKLTNIGTTSALGVTFLPPYQKLLRNSIREPLNRAKSAVRKSPEIQKDILRYGLRTKEELQNKTKIDDTTLENRLRALSRDYGLGYSDVSRQQQQAKKALRTIGISPLSSQSIDKLFAKRGASSLDLEFQNKLNALKNHTDITDEATRQRMIDRLTQKYKSKGATLNTTKDVANDKVYRKVLKNNLVAAALRPTATVAGTVVTAQALSNIIGSKRKKNKERNKTNYIKAGLGLGLIGYGTLSRKNRIVKSFLRRNKKGTVTNVSGHTRMLG